MVGEGNFDAAAGGPTRGPTVATKVPEIKVKDFVSDVGKVYAASSVNQVTLVHQEPDPATGGGKAGIARVVQSEPAVVRRGLVGRQEIVVAFDAEDDVASLPVVAGLKATDHGRPGEVRCRYRQKLASWRGFSDRTIDGGGADIGPEIKTGPGVES